MTKVQLFRRLRDDFQLDALSHGSSHEGMGTVSVVHTPLQGSVDNMDSLDILSESLTAPELSVTDVLGGLEKEEDAVSLGSLVSRSSQLTAQNSWTPQARQDTDTGSVSSLPSYNQAMASETVSGSSKKKIIPVQSDSSESAPSSPTESPPPSSLSLSARFRKSQQQAEEPQSLQTHTALGQKLKNSYSKSPSVST